MTIVDNLERLSMIRELAPATTPDALALGVRGVDGVPDFTAFDLAGSSSCSAPAPSTSPGMTDGSGPKRTR